MANNEHIRPKEYTNSSYNIEQLDKVVSVFDSGSFDLNSTLYHLVYNHLENLNEISFGEFKRSVVKDIMFEWEKEVIPNDYSFANIVFQEDYDVLGLSYQMLLSRNKKKELGSYYTPKEEVLRCLEGVAEIGKTLLEPSCGSGAYLIAAHKHFGLPIEDLYGFDLDPIAVRLCKLNLLLSNTSYDKMPNVYNENALKKLSNNKLFESSMIYDRISTNPPWGGDTKDSYDSFADFILKSIKAIPKKEKASFLVPSSLLNIAQYESLRKYILDKTTIDEIEIIDNVFSGVAVESCIIKITKERVDKKTKLICGGKTYYRNQHEFYNNPKTIFDAKTTIEDKNILDKIYNKKHSTLENNSEWSLGIVTGDNKKFISDDNTKEKIIVGKDLSKYEIKPSTKYIDVCGVRYLSDEAIFKQKKLVYKFISSELVFAIDENFAYTLNSCNILIPKNIDMVVLMCLFNSSLYNFLFKKVIGSIKILKSDLEQLPLPHIKEEFEMELKEAYSNKQYEKINELVFEYFDITHTERLAIVAG